MLLVCYTANRIQVLLEEQSHYTKTIWLSLLWQLLTFWTKREWTQLSSSALHNRSTEVIRTGLSDLCLISQVPCVVFVCKESRQKHSKETKYSCSFWFKNLVEVKLRWLFVQNSPTAKVVKSMDTDRFLAPTVVVDPRRCEGQSPPLVSNFCFPVVFEENKPN